MGLPPIAAFFRRGLFLLGLTLVFTASGAGWGASSASGQQTLRVLAWPGYADPEVVKAFEERRRVRVELTLVSSDEALWQKISANQGADFDVFAVNTAELQRYIDRGLVLPIAPEAIPNIRRQLPRFRDPAAIPGLVRDGKVYGVPYTYAEMGLIYDRAQVAQAPDSIAALWDPRFRGRVLAYNGASHNFSLAALTLGSAAPFRIADDSWPQVVERLIALRRNVLSFYSLPEESVELFTRHRVALLFANYGAQQLRLLQASGADVGYVIPKEGALAWLDCWVITGGVRDRALAHEWIDYMLEESVSGLLVTRQGLASTIAPSSANRPDDRLLWLEPVEDVGRREAMWERVLSGDRTERVLAP